MAESTDRLLAHRVIAKVAAKTRLSLVERTVVNLLKAGYGQPVIAGMLDINLAHVVKDLVAKGAMYPDTTLRKPEPRELYSQGYIFSKPAENIFYDAWVCSLDDIRELDIGEACLAAHELPLHYVLDATEIAHKPNKNKKATKFTEVSRGGFRACQT